MLKKIMNIFTLLVLTVSLIPSIEVSAVNYTDDFITKKELQDEHGIAKNEFEINETMKSYFEFNIPDGYIIKTGDTMKISIPKQLSIANDVTFDLRDDSGNLVGIATVDKSTGEISIVFTDYYETHTINRHGSFSITTTWNKAVVSEDTDEIINGNIIHINSPNVPDQDELLYKWGWIDESNPNIINWKVRVNYKNDTITNAIYTDFIGENQYLISGSILVELGTYNANDFVSESILDKNSIVESNDGTSFKVNYGNLSKASLITYQTKITKNNATTDYNNTGELTGTNIKTQNTEVLVKKTDGNGNGSGTTEPSTTEPSTTEPSTTEPSTTEPSTTEPSTTEPSTTEPSTTEPSTTEPSTTEPSTTEPSTTEPSTTEPSTTEPSTTEPSTTEPSTTEPSTTEPSTTEPSLLKGRFPTTGFKNNKLLISIGVFLLFLVLIFYLKKINNH